MSARIPLQTINFSLRSVATRPKYAFTLTDSLLLILAQVSNALDADKRFTQVHYMKGYFFLKSLEKIVPGGEKEMLQIVNQFVTKFAQGAYITVPA